MLSQSIFAISLTLTGLDVADATHIRIKIENGIVFIKPAKDTALDRRRNQDLHKIVEHDHTSVVCVLRGAMVSRVIAYLSSRGWCENAPYFVLNPASRGWYGISVQPNEITDPETPMVAIAAVIGIEEVTAVLKDIASAQMAYS